MPVKVSVTNGGDSIKAKVTQSNVKAKIDTTAASRSLNSLTDTSVASPMDGDVIIYNDTEQKWESHQLTTSNVLDIDNTNKQDGSVLVYTTTNQKYTATNVLDNQNTQINGGSF